MCWSRLDSAVREFYSLRPEYRLNLQTESRVTEEEPSEQLRGGKDRFQADLRCFVSLTISTV